MANSHLLATKYFYDWLKTTQWLKFVSSLSSLSRILSACTVAIMDVLTAPLDRAITKLGIGSVLSLLEALQRAHSTHAESAPHGYFFEISTIRRTCGLVRMIHSQSMFT